MKEQNENVVWQYLKDLTAEVEKLKEKVEVNKNILIKLKPKDYIEFIKTKTNLTPQELEFLKAKHGIKEGEV